MTTQNEITKDKITEAQYSRLERDLTKLFKALKKDIGNEYRASDDDTLPSMQVTIGASIAEDGTGFYLSWNYQTGDNSYTGGAYSHPYWGVVSLYRTSRSADIAHDAVEQIADAICS